MQIAPACPQEGKNRCSEHVGPKIQNKSPHVFQCSREGGGGAVSRSMVSSANFSPSPFLGACVMACDTEPREHGRRGDVCTHYTSVTCRVSDTLLPGWVFLAQVWAGIGFSTPPPPRRLSKQHHCYPREDCILGKTCHLSRGWDTPHHTPPCTQQGLGPSRAGALNCPCFKTQSILFTSCLLPSPAATPPQPSLSTLQI